MASERAQQIRDWLMQAIRVAPAEEIVDYVQHQIDAAVREERERAAEVAESTIDPGTQLYGTAYRHLQWHEIAARIRQEPQ